jgi:hypothetical protein
MSYSLCFRFEHCLSAFIALPKPCENNVSALGGSVFYTETLPYFSFENLDVAAVGGKSAQDVAEIIKFNALQRIEDDFSSYVRAHGYMVNSIVSANTFFNGVAPQPNCGAFVPPPTPLNPYRGVQFTAKKQGGLQRIKINKLWVAPKTSGVVQVLIEHIEQSNVIAAVYYPINAIGGQLNDVFVLGGFAPITAQGSVLRITVDNAITPMCLTESNACGCSGGFSAPCYTYNYYDGGTLKSGKHGNSYGVYAQVSCICDFSQLVCKLANDGVIPSNLFRYAFEYEYAKYLSEVPHLDGKIIYNTAKYKEMTAMAKMQYDTLYSEIAQGLYKMLNKIDAQCIICNTTQWKQGA